MKGKKIIWTLLALLACGLPFIFNGYGSEEDAWGLIVTARESLISGIYEVSRLPGHPLQEILLIPAHLLPAWFLNLSTLIISVTGVYFFIRILRHLNLKGSLSLGVSLMFTPVFFINSSNIMDYNWATSLLIISTYRVLKGRWIVAAVLIGLATGFRITSLAMMFPFFFLMETSFSDKPSLKRYFLFCVLSVSVSLVMFIPPLIAYGSSFFTFYQYFPYPPLLKNIYKASIGVWGTAGLAYIFFLCVAILPLLFQKFKKREFSNVQQFCLAAIILYSISFLRIPQKSAFIIVTLPWMYLFFATLAPERLLKPMPYIMVFSTALLGMNIISPLRGSTPSSASLSFRAGGSDVTLDLLKGPAIADMEKRRNKIEYAKRVSDFLESPPHKILMIAGWYQNEIVYHTGAFETENYKIVYYEDEPVLRKYFNDGYKILYLPEQNRYNDLRFQKIFTENYAVPFIPESGQGLIPYSPDSTHLKSYVGP